LRAWGKMIPGESVTFNSGTGVCRSTRSEMRKQRPTIGGSGAPRNRG